MRGTCTYRELEEALGLTNASVSRTVTALAEQHRTGRPGRQLLEMFHDPREGRRYRVRLSPRGKSIAKQLEFALERTTTEPVP
jgi:DNA-binding MarR family transcriptional regulator